MFVDGAGPNDNIIKIDVACMANMVVKCGRDLLLVDCGHIANAHGHYHPLV